MPGNVTQWLARIAAGTGIVVATAVLLVVLFLGFIVVTDYRPAAVEPAETLRNPPAAALVPTGTPLRITTFNIGYAGLDAGQDFFMDGGTGSRSRSLEQTLHNMDGILSFIRGHQADIYALQEVDRKSSRSFDTDQVQMITDAMGADYGAWFAWNYRAKWVPLPVTRPMGYTNSGLLTLARYHSTEATRYALPGDEPVPKRYFDLKRAMTEHVFPVENGRHLYFINLHLSAFDKGGTVRAQQVAFLTDHIRELYRDGHYVILAGDWNHLLDMSVLEGRTVPLPEWIAILPDSFLALDFTLAYDGSVNTVRDNSAPYVGGRNFETVIDGFFISNNVTVLETRGTDLQFRHSDHNPVTVTVVLE
jgi:endonuclease/exonuclease/phosphatase family metal-dependent hydrolase